MFLKNFDSMVLSAQPLGYIHVYDLFFLASSLKPLCQSFANRKFYVEPALEEDT